MTYKTYSNTIVDIKNNGNIYSGYIELDNGFTLDSWIVYDITAEYPKVAFNSFYYEKNYFRKRKAVLSAIKKYNK